MSQVQREAVLKDHSHLGCLAGAMDEQPMVAHIDQLPTQSVVPSEECKSSRESETQN
jgi:hypothetical protein